MRLNKNLDIPGAGKNGGTLRAYLFNRRVHYWVEGYDQRPTNLDLPEAQPLSAKDRT